MLLTYFHSLQGMDISLICGYFRWSTALKLFSGNNSLYFYNKTLPPPLRRKINYSCFLEMKCMYIYILDYSLPHPLHPFSLKMTRAIFEKWNICMYAYIQGDSLSSVHILEAIGYLKENQFSDSKAGSETQS